MKKQLLQALAAAAVLAAAPAFAQNIAIVNGVPIPHARLDELTQRLQAQAGGKPIPPQMQDQLKEALITQEVFVQAAKQKGIDKTPDYLSEVEFAKQNILANMLFANYTKTHPISDADVKAAYDKLVAANSGKEYHAHHILVASQADADKVLAELKGGAKFEDLAKKYSKDPGSAANGGDLDWTTPAGLVPEFAKAMIALKPGETTTAPVKTEFGWHIIRLDDIRDQQFPKLEEIKPQLVKQMEQKQLQDYQEELRAKAKVQ
jgi:peptidyl-prolyl cis-trans isomerase C